MLMILFRIYRSRGFEEEVRSWSVVVESLPAHTVSLLFPSLFTCRSTSILLLATSIFRLRIRMLLTGRPVSLPLPAQRSVQRQKVRLCSFH